MIRGSKYFQHLTKGTQRVVDGCSRIYYSELNQYQSDNAFRNFSIKLPVEGVVHYRTCNQSFDLDPDHFLLISKQPGKVFFDSGTVVKSICIDINEQAFAEAFTVLSACKDISLDNLQAGYFSNPDFFEYAYPVKNDSLGMALSSIGRRLKNNEMNEVGDEIFFDLAEKIIFHQNSYYRSLNGLVSCKASTKKEILRRLLMGKYFIDEYFLQNPDIAMIAGYANLSQFHFFRSFKLAFGISPYRYMFEKRLAHSMLLLKNFMQVQDVADACGFPDIFTFSKAFKKKYGYPPSVYKKTKPIADTLDV